MVQMSKVSLRKTYKQIREGLSSNEVKKLSALINKNLLKQSEYQVASNIGSYYSIKNEVIVNIDVGKRLTISMLEKGLFFIKSLATMLYSLEELNIISCKLRNVPSTFETMLTFLKPLLSKHALSVLEIEKS